MAVLRFAIGETALIAGLCFSVPGYAQTQPASARNSNETYGDIVVTANKREQRLNDVGLAVAVIGGDALREQQITSLADIANATPSLSYSNSVQGTPIYTLRGVGFNEQSIGSYPAVSVYMDEVPLPFPVLTANQIYDLERLEVLKGPQGTLFGQNATGGAINYIAAKPQDEFGGGIDLTYGRFNSIMADAFITGPLAPNLNFRLSGRFEDADGWQVSNTRPDDRNGKIERYMGRLQLQFEPSDAISLLLNVNAYKDKSETQAPQTIAYNIQNPIADPDLLATTLSSERTRASDWTPGFTFGDREQWQASLRADISLNDAITLTSITSYVDYKHRKANDGDGFSILTYDTPLDQGKIKSFSQELRLANDAADRFRWVIGANYEDSSADQYVDLLFPDSSSGATLATLGYPIGQSFYYNYQDFKNYAFFGNGEFDVTDRLTLKAGIRYTNAKDSVRGCHGEKSGRTDQAGSFFYDILLGGALGPYPQGACFMINDQPLAIGGVQPGMPGEYVDTLKEDNVSWRIGADFKPSSNLLLYANAAKGYKAGSFPTSASSAFISYLPVTQESVMSYEAGFKATLADRKVQLNGAAFYYDYKDKQLRSRVLLLPFGNLDVLQNIPESSVKGFELELNARPVSGLVFNVAFTYLDATIDKFVGQNAGGLPGDFGGTRMPFTPKYQASASLDYEFPVSDGLEAFVGASANARSKTISIVGGNLNPPTSSVQDEPVFRIGNYTLLDLRAGIKSTDDRWRVTVWGKNVTNEYYWNNVAAVFDTISRYTGMPATYGATVGFRY